MELYSIYVNKIIYSTSVIFVNRESELLRCAWLSVGMWEEIDKISVGSQQFGFLSSHPYTCVE